jgi:hypothetical protein
MSILFFDEADIAAALDVAFFDVLQIFRARLQSHVFFYIVFRDVVTTHGSQDEVAMLDDEFGRTFD